MAVSDGDVLKVVLSVEAPDIVVAQNVWYYRLDDPVPDNPTNTQIINTLQTKFQAMATDIAAVLSDEYTWDVIKTDRIEWQVDHWETVENLGEKNVLVDGTAIQDAVPHGVAGLITAVTSRPQTRARKFLAGFGEGEFADSTLSGTLLTAMAALIVEWLTDATVTGSAVLEPVVVGQSGPSAGLIYALVAAAANGIGAYQRRRKPGVGS